MPYVLSLVLALVVLAAGCAESRSPAPAPSCSSSGPMLTPDEQRPILGAVFVVEDDGGGEVCALGPFNYAAPESFVRDCAAYVDEAATCEELRARADECRVIGLRCGIFAEVGP